MEVPFSGSSGYVALAPILGYDLQLPLPYSTCKGIELACASQQYMMINPANSMGTFTQIYIKKLQQSDPESFDEPTPS